MVDNGLEIVLIKTGMIEPNEYNPNIVPGDIMAKLRQEIAQKGLCEPIIVRKRGDGYSIIDGEHRWQLCKELGLQEIPCIIQDYDDKEAKIKTLQLNYMRGSAVPIKLAYLIHDLNKEIKLEDLAKRLPYEEIQLMDSLELLKLPEGLDKTLELEAMKEEGEMPVVLSFVLYKKQAEVVEKAIGKAVQNLPEGAKNLKAMALEYICAQYLEPQGLTKETEVAVEKEELI